MKKIYLSVACIASTLFFYQTNVYAQCIDVGNGADGALVVTGTTTLSSDTLYNFSSVTIENGGVLTVNGWDGTSGGTLSFKVQDTLHINSGGSIDVTAKGYRGGDAVPQTTNGQAYQGESYNGVGTQAQNGNDGAGGGGPASGVYGGTGGAGGSYGTQGHYADTNHHNNGSNPGGYAGTTYGAPDLTVLHLGSGGGSGHPYATGGFPYGAGGNGGGAINITANVIIVDGEMLCDGDTGQYALSGTYGSGGGGGSGGSIFLTAASVYNNGLISAVGGIKGEWGKHPSYPEPNHNIGSDGGHGGDGRIRIDYAQLIDSGLVQPAIGYTEVAGALATLSSNSVQCFGDSSGTATAEVIGGVPPYTFLWDDPNNQTDSIATGLSGGTYQVTITDDNGCTIIDSVTVTEASQALTVATSAVDDAGGCVGSATATPSGGLAAYTYLWDDPNTQTTATATGLCGGLYNVTVTDSLGCAVNENQFVDFPASIGSVATEGNISIYPNPASNNIMVKSPLAGAYQIYDAKGQWVASGQFNKQLSVAEFSKGIYFVKHQATVLKVVVQ